MRKYLSLFLLIAVLIPLTAEAITVKIENPLAAKNFWDLIDKLIDFIFYLAIAVAPIMFIA
ncbi:unnamed protein product, partial [marine sediment metagenome]